MSGTTGTIPLQNAVADQLITSAERNAELANISALMDTKGIGGHSDTDAETQIQTAPFPGSVLSKATSDAGELERLRYQIAQILGTDYWYKPAATNLTSVGNVVVPLGGIIDYPVATAPSSSWHLADGTAISRAVYATLFSLIGTTFGVGDNATTFNLPDYRDRMSIGAGTSYAVGATGGAVSNSPSVTVTDPGHNHTQNSHTHTMGNHTHVGASHSHTLSRTQVGTNVGATLVTGATTGGESANVTSGPSTNTSDATTPTNNSSTTGITASVPTIPTLPPYLGIYKLIRVL